MAKAYRSRRISRTIAVVALASAAGLGLSGCGASGSPGTAFIVNGESFSERDLTDTVEQWTVIAGAEVPRDEMVNYLVQTNLRLQAAESVGIVVSDEEVQQTLDGMLAEADTTLTASEIVRPIRDLFRDLLFVNTVRDGEVSDAQIEELDAFIADSTVTVNPRYGTYADGAVEAPGDLGSAIGGSV